MLLELSTCLLLAAPGALAQEPASQPAAQTPAPPTDAELRTAFRTLTPAAQEELAQRFAAEVIWLDTLQYTLIRHALSLEEIDPGLLPDAPPTPIYDPKVHAPAQPIARRLLAPTDPLAIKDRERMFGRTPQRALQPAWRYDWGARKVQRTGDPRAPERVFENALAGYQPDADLAEAIVQSVLDRGEEQKILAAFGHLYTDRSGNAFPGITLYDAWGSGQEIEMPDVDVLGIVHDVLGDTKTWIAPVPENQHESLYDKVGELFQSARRYRGLRQALAIAYLNGYGELRDSYAGHVNRLHALWESVSSTPSELTPALPDAAHWADYLQALSERVDSNTATMQAALNRRAALEQDAWRVRALMIRLLEETKAQAQPAHPAGG